MLKAPRPNLTAKSTRPLSNIYLGSRRHSKETNTSQQGFSNRPWTSNLLGKVDSNRNVASTSATKMQQEATYRQPEPSTAYFKKIRGLSAANVAQTPKPEQAVQKELFGNQYLQKKKSSLLQMQNIAAYNKSPTTQTNASGTTGTVRFLSKAMDAAAAHGQGKYQKKRIIFTQDSQRRPQTSIRMNSSLNKRDQHGRMHPQIKSYESATFLNRNNSSQIDFANASDQQQQQQNQHRKNQQAPQAQTSQQHIQPSTKLQLLMSKRHLAGQSNASGKNFQNSSRSLLEYFDKQTGKAPGMGMKMKKIRMGTAMHSKRQTVAEMHVLPEKPMQDPSGRATPSFLTSQQAIDKYRKVQSVTPCVITDATMSQKGGVDSTAAGSKQLEHHQRMLQHPDSFEQRSRSTLAGQVFLVSNDNMSQDNLRSSLYYNRAQLPPTGQKIIMLNNASQSQINSSVLSNEINIEDHLQSRNLHYTQIGASNADSQVNNTRGEDRILVDQEHYQAFDSRGAGSRIDSGIQSQQKTSSRADFDQDYQHSSFNQSKTANKIMVRKIKQTGKVFGQRSFQRMMDPPVGGKDHSKLRKGILTTSNSALSNKDFGVVHEKQDEGADFGRMIEHDYYAYNQLKNASRNNSQNKLRSHERSKKGAAANPSQKIKQIQLKSRNIISQQVNTENVNQMDYQKRKQQQYKESRLRGARSINQARTNSRDRSNSKKTSSKSPERQNLAKQAEDAAIQQANMTPKLSQTKRMLSGRFYQNQMQSQRIIQNHHKSPDQSPGRLDKSKSQKMKQVNSYKQVSINITPRIPQMNQKEKHEVVEHSRNSSFKNPLKNNIVSESNRDLLQDTSVKQQILPDGRVILEQYDTLNKNSIQNIADDSENQENEVLYDQSIMVKEMNTKITENIDVLAKYQNFMTNFDPEYEKLQNLDADQVLQDASKQIKIIKYQCNNAVVQDDQRHIVLRTPGPLDGVKPGLETVVDIIEKCPLACKIEVYGRRMPINIHLNYSYNFQTATTETNVENSIENAKNSQQSIEQMPAMKSQRPKTAVIKYSSTKSRSKLRNLKNKLRKNLPELNFFISNYDKLPNEQTAFQVVKNPGTRFQIKYDKSMSATVDQDRRGGTKEVTNQKISLSKNHFDVQHFYINIMSEQGCTIGISCSFPEQNKDAPRNIEGALDEEGNLAAARVNEKDFRSKIKNEINNQMEDLLNDMRKQREFFVNLEKMRRDKIVAEARHSDINFIHKNANVDDVMEELQMKLVNSREINIIRTQQAALRKQSIEDERVEKIRFDMLKWDLYRLKCDDIDERHAQFKKLQMKILWWNQIISRHRMCKKAKWNFDEHLKKVITAAREMLKAFKIQYHFRKYMLRFRPDKGQRDRNKVKNILTFLHLSKWMPPQERAHSIIYQFLYKRQVEQNMQKVFRVFWQTANKINLKLKDIRSARECKKELILYQFEREHKILNKHYLEKSKGKGKNKKEFQRKQMDLMNMKTECKDIVLRYYYDYFVAFTNIKSAIHWCAIDGVKKNKRKLEDNFTDQEFRYLQLIETQLKIVQDFILKGTKDHKPLGEPPYDDQLYPLEKNEQSEPSARKQDQNKDNGQNLSDESGEDEEDVPGELNQQQTIQTTLEPLEDQQKEQKKSGAEKETSQSPGKAQKKAQKIVPADPQPVVKAPKSKERSLERGGKSGKKKKQSKVTNTKLENIIDMDLNPQRNKYIPTRSMMQRLVMRAAALDPKEVEQLPLIEDIRPWIKKDNRDILF